MNRKTNFEVWVEICKQSNTVICELENNGKKTLYKTYKEILYKNNYNPTDVYFHVWCNDNWKSFTDYRTAFAEFERE